MTYHELKAFLERIKCGFGITFLLEVISGRMFLQAQMPIADIYTGKNGFLKGTKHNLDFYVMDEATALHLVEVAAKELLAHEFDELFCLDGKQVNDPHGR